ncbi:MAG: septum formation protein Maf [Ruminococcaceae bacterium]|nr:septum formation protein Maf [Oscillospiraceae bacterium]
MSKEEMSLILASASPRRKELLSCITEDFKVIPAKNEEKIDLALSPDKAVIYVAGQKAEEVSALYPKDIVIGADTTVFCQNIPLGKPKDSDDAKEMLKMLSGKVHKVITAAVIAVGGKAVRSFAEETEVEFYPLSEEEIDLYVKSGEPMDKAGAYGIQGKGSLLIKGIKGDYYNVMGLPVSRLYRELTAFVSENKENV